VSLDNRINDKLYGQLYGYYMFNHKERISMKNFKIIVFALFIVLALTACDGDDDNKGGGTSLDPITPEGKTYRQSVTLDAQGSEQTVTLSDLKSKIDNVENGNTDWLTVLQNTYTSGSPSIVVRATERTETTERSGNVTITAVSGDKVILNVTQQGAEKTGIDDSHDVPTDKPAYSRQR